MITSAPPTILLVEDDDVEAERVTRAASRMATPLAVRRAYDAVEALGILRGEIEPLLRRPYLVLLDLKLPRMGGIQFLQEVRRDPALRKTVVFVLTTSRDEEDRFRAYEHMVAGYIPKSKQGGESEDVIQLLWRYLEVVVLP